MSGFLEKLGLQPQERRLVVIVGVVVFIVLNFWFVFPMFGELGKTQRLIKQAQAQLDLFKSEVDKKQKYQGQREALAELGGYIPMEEQITAFSREVQNKATLSGIKLPTMVPGSPGTLLGTNAFFEEQTLVISVGNTTRPRELVTFLYNLSKENSLIRVSSMNLRPDPSHIYLLGNMTLVKSFQRIAASRPAASPRPAASSAVSTNQRAATAPASNRVASSSQPAATSPGLTASNAAAAKPAPRSAPAPAPASTPSSKRTMPNPAQPK